MIRLSGFARVQFILETELSPLEGQSSWLNARLGFVIHTYGPHGIPVRTSRYVLLPTECLNTRGNKKREALETRREETLMGLKGPESWARRFLVRADNDA